MRQIHVSNGNSLQDWKKRTLYLSHSYWRKNRPNSLSSSTNPFLYTRAWNRCTDITSVHYRFCSDIFKFCSDIVRFCSYCHCMHSRTATRILYTICTENVRPLFQALVYPHNLAGVGHCTMVLDQLLHLDLVEYSCNEYCDLIDASSLQQLV